MVSEKTADTGIAEVDGDEPDDEDAKTRGSIMVGMPIEMKQMVVEAAKADNASTQGFVRAMLAQAVGYTGPLTKGKAKAEYEGTPEERKAQRKAVAKERREIFGKLLAKYSGNLDKLAEDLLPDEDDEEDE